MDLQTNWLTVQEFCKETGMTRAAVQKWIEQGKIKAVKKSFGWLIPRNQTQKIGTYRKRIEKVGDGLQPDTD